MFIDIIFRRFLSFEHKRNIFGLGIFVSVIGVIIGTVLFPDNAALPVIFFTTMPLVPFTNKIIHKKIKNREIAEIYFLLFLGMMIVFGVAYVTLFETFDISIYKNIGGQDSFQLFSSILSNNVRLVFILFLLSMLYGIGSLFILALNAALIGQLFGSFVVFERLDLLLVWIPHTSIEFASFFLAAIAGALLTIAFTTHEKRDTHFDERIFRASVFFMFSVMFVILGALVESFLLPQLLVNII